MFCYSEKMVIVLVCEHAYRVRYSCVNIHSNIFIGSSYKLLASCVHTRLGVAKLEWAGVQDWNGLGYSESGAEAKVINIASPSRDAITKVTEQLCPPACSSEDSCRLMVT